MTTPFEYFRTPITLRSYATGSYINGVWVQGASTDQQITASIQPITGEEMESLPETRRESEGYNMFTSTRVRTVQEAGSNLNADHVIFNNKEFEIYDVKPWQNNSNFTITNHYHYFIFRVDN